MPRRDEEDQIEAMRRHLELEKKAKKILGLDAQLPTTNKEAINQAWRGLSAKWHPDKHGNSQEAHHRFLVIACAYRYLMQGEDCPELDSEDVVDQGKPAGEFRLENDWGYFAWWKDSYLDE